jgi:hypothetical protein
MFKQGSFFTEVSLYYTQIDNFSSLYIWSSPLQQKIILQMAWHQQIVPLIDSI